MWQYNTNYLSHHGILGQKWGIRRFQNPDGSLTPAGKKRYGAESTSDISSTKGIQRRLNDVDIAIARNKRSFSDEKDEEEKYAIKLGKLLDENEDENTRKKIERKMETAGYLSTYYKQNIDKGNKEIDELIDIVNKMGYNIDKRSINRDVSGKQELIKSMLITAITAPTVGAVVSTHKTIPGTLYKVKRQK